MNIAIIGIGALGSHLVQLLRNEEVSLTVVDHDRVESHNVGSQFHGKPSIGKKKVGSLKETMKFLFGATLTSIPHKVTSDNIQQVLGSSDLLIDCMDNANGRRLVQAFGTANGIPTLHGGLAAGGEFARVAWEDFFIVDEEPSGTPTCEEGEFLPFIVLVASYMGLVVQRFLKEGKCLNFNIYPEGAKLF